MERFIDTQEWVPVHTLQGMEACIEYYVNRDGKVLKYEIQARSNS